MSPNDDPVLVRFRTAVEKAYGDRVERIVLFGSRARSDSHAGSDYDVAVFLKHPQSFDKEARTLAEIETDILTTTGAIINALPLAADAYREQSALMRELRRDGREL